MNPRHNWKDGVRRIPLHLATWGLGGAVVAILLGWLPLAFVLGAAIRGEYQDVTNGDDTAGKAAIDFVSQVILPALAGILRHRL